MLEITQREHNIIENNVSFIISYNLYIFNNTVKVFCEMILKQNVQIR